MRRSFALLCIAATSTRPTHVHAASSITSVCPTSPGSAPHWNAGLSPPLLDLIRAIRRRARRSPRSVTLKRPARRPRAPRLRRRDRAAPGPPWSSLASRDRDHSARRIVTAASPRAPAITMAASDAIRAARPSTDSAASSRSFAERIRSPRAPSRPRARALPIDPLRRNDSLIYGALPLARDVLSAPALAVRVTVRHTRGTRS